MNNIDALSGKQKTGMKCPQCGEFINMTIFQLLMAGAIKCSECHLLLTIDKMRSKKAFEVLRKVQKAQENLENSSKFSR